MTTHHYADVNGTTLHHVEAGTAGTPILLVHGFPESLHAFHRLIPLLAAQHRVFAVDLRGFGDSAVAGDDFDSVVAAADLHALIRHLGAGPVHLLGQDISGGTVFRLAVTHPEDVRSLIAVEMGLPGFGLEPLADVTHGGAWHIGVLAAPAIADMLLTGRERDFLSRYAFPSMTARPGSVTDADIEEFTRAYARIGGWNGAAGLYRSMLREGAEIQALAASPGLRAPVLAIGAGGGPFTATTMEAATMGEVTTVQLESVGHYAALEAPEELARAILTWTS